MLLIHKSVRIFQWACELHRRHKHTGKKLACLQAFSCHQSMVFLEVEEILRSFKISELNKMLYFVNSDKWTPNLIELSKLSAALVKRRSNTQYIGLGSTKCRSMADLILQYFLLCIGEKCMLNEEVHTLLPRWPPLCS